MVEKLSHLAPSDDRSDVHQSFRARISHHAEILRRILVCRSFLERERTHVFHFLACSSVMPDTQRYVERLDPET